MYISAHGLSEVILNPRGFTKSKFPKILSRIIHSEKGHKSNIWSYSKGQTVKREQKKKILLPLQNIFLGIANIYDSA